jgi:CRP-like cAMP-binding protein
VETGVLINLPLSREDLAEMTGTTLFTVSRILNRWQQRGFVELGRRRVVILDGHGLVAIAENGVSEQARGQVDP